MNQHGVKEVVRACVVRRENVLSKGAAIVVNYAGKLVNDNGFCRLTLMMASMCGRQLLCFIHIGGQFVMSGEGNMTYCGGTVRTKIIKEGTSYEEFKSMISSIMGKESNGIVMKFTVTFDTTTFVDIVDDEGIEHLINFNGDSGHIYVAENRVDNTEPARDELGEELYVTDYMFGGSDVLSVSTPSLCNDYSPSFACATEMITVGRPEMNSTKWNDLIIGKGQVFPTAAALRKTLYKYRQNTCYKGTNKGRRKHRQNTCIVTRKKERVCIL